MLKVPVNPEILKWAREELNMSLDEVARRTGKSVSIIKQWELGTDAPSYAQLEKIAYDIYKIPLAVFFFPEHPDLGYTQRSFRTLPNSIYESIPSNMIKLFRKADVLKENLIEINDNLNNEYIEFLDKLKINSYDKILEQLRSLLGVSLSEQKSWKSSKNALELWREKFESIGIYIFKDAFKDNAYSGFCLYDKLFPIIYINNSMPVNRQIFTLFHEFWHIHSQTSGIDNSNDSEEYFSLLNDEGKNMEIICNKFAGDFLVPNDDFDYESKKINGINEDSILKLAELYKVSREVILRKFYDRKFINNNQYENFTYSWLEDMKKITKKGRGDYYNNLITYLGDNYLNKAYTKYYKNQINELQLAEYLNVKKETLLPLEGKLNRRWQ